MFMTCQQSAVTIDGCKIRSNYISKTISHSTALISLKLALLPFGVSSFTTTQYTKLWFMLNEDGTPRRNEIVFISPTGEEINSRRQLQQYLKTHPGGPASSEFDWGTGDTPRRSARIRERAKAVETPEDEKPKKRERKSSSKKGAKEKKDDGDQPDETSGVKDDVTTEEAKAPADVEVKEAGDDVSEVKDKGVEVGIAVNEGVSVDDAVNKETTTEVVNKGAEEQDSVLKTNRSVKEKTEASLKNNGATAPGVDVAISVPETGKNKAENETDDSVSPPAGDPEEVSAAKENRDQEILSGNSSHKEDADGVVLKGTQSASCGDGQMLPKTSPVNC